MESEPNAADESGSDGVASVRRYYDALDEHDYDALEALLRPEFVQRRPDRTFENREAFVRFMAEDRPSPDTSHELESTVADGNRIAVRGRVVEGERTLFEFADFFELEGGKIRRLETYSR
ncbi:nuclear transport factor 2 family protein [Natrinema salinisoli]|uniref:nuclear transport factor 2 family protein n=1 Tax=Natrinema salinisoli TaxID=2878535 RepID=UPI001CF096A0|nr:nuclear transport factor 2 family protein [Natrinema salinisoli]